MPTSRLPPLLTGKRARVVPLDPGMQPPPREAAIGGATAEVPGSSPPINPPSAERPDTPGVQAAAAGTQHGDSASAVQVHEWILAALQRRGLEIAKVVDDDSMPRLLKHSSLVGKQYVRETRLSSAQPPAKAVRAHATMDPVMLVAHDVIC